MIIRAKRTPLEESLEIIDQIPYLESANTLYPPYQVIVRRNDRFEENLIQLENFCEFAVANGITDAGYAIAEICKANGISSNNIGFAVNEASCYADDETFETAVLLRENGYHVYLAPTPKSSIYYQELVEAMELDIDQPDDQCYNIMAYCEVYTDVEPDNSVLDRASNSINNTVAAGEKKLGQRVDRMAKDAQAGAHWATKGVRRMANKYSAAKNLAGELATKAGNTAGATKSFFQRQADRAGRVANWFKDKLGQAKNVAGQGFDYAKSKASGLFGAAKSGVGAVASGIKNVGALARDTASRGVQLGSQGAHSVGRGLQNTATGIKNIAHTT